MSWKGKWLSGRGDFGGAVGRIHTQIPGASVEISVFAEYVEDDGQPFADGEEVEILVRRVSRATSEKGCLTPRSALIKEAQGKPTTSFIDYSLLHADLVRVGVTLGARRYSHQHPMDGAHEFAQAALNVIRKLR